MGVLLRAILVPLVRVVLIKKEITRHGDLDSSQPSLLNLVRHLLKTVLLNKIGERPTHTSGWHTCNESSINIC